MNQLRTIDPSNDDQREAFAIVKVFCDVLPEHHASIAARTFEVAERLRRYRLIAARDAREDTIRNLRVGMEAATP